MYRLMLLPIVLCASALAAGPISLPPGFQTCSRSAKAKDFNNCEKNAVQSALKLLIPGSRPLGVLPIDPLQITTLGINQGSGPVAVNLNFNNLLIKGIGNIVVESVDAQLTGDVKTLTFEVKCDEPLTLEGQYTINGKVLVLPISGSGDSMIELTGSRATLTLIGKEVTKEGNTYMVIQSGKFSLNPSKVKMFFANLFNGDKALGDNMNKFLNENWEEIYGELKDPIQKALVTTFIEITNRIFAKVPFDFIFPK